MKHILAGLALAALLLFQPPAEAQVAGACPANQFVNVVGNNIPAAACSQPTYANLAGSSFLGALFSFGATTPTHVASAQTTPPALTSCGTSPSISGTDTAGTVTMGTGSPTGCVITFNVAYTTAPHCTVTFRASIVAYTYTVSGAAITTTQTATSSNLLDYVCVAPSGG
jgi:hypothetical protein